jgi:hypothetical protein
METARPGGSDHDWPLLARLNAAGARIVSVPLPLVARAGRPGTLERDPSDALLVVEAFESALPDQFRLVARLAAGLAAQTPEPPPPSYGLRRRLRRLAGRFI